MPRRPSQNPPDPAGIAQGVPTAQLARELDCDRMHLLDLCHCIRERAHSRMDRNPLGEGRADADEIR